MQIKHLRAINTRYNGYVFRSRLEARWAVFFDHLGIKWEYEPEGFELGNGLRYLPDFYLPGMELWVEVKPGPPDAVAREKAARLSYLSEKPLLFVHGMPDAPGTLFYARVQQGGEVGLLSWRAWVAWQEPTIYTQEPAEEIHLPGLDVYPMRQLGHEQIGAAAEALAAARSARFEFNQKGAQ